MDDFTELDAIELRKVILDAFPDPIEFDMFISGTGKFEDLTRRIDMTLGYEARVYRYITAYLMPNANVELFLEELANRFEEHENEAYLARVQSLMSPDRVERSLYFNFYNGSNVPFNLLKRKVFGDWFRNFHSITKPDMWAVASDRTKYQIDRSQYYIAVVGQNSVTRPRPANDPIFNNAFTAWVNSLNLPPRDQKRFVLLLAADGNAWWDKWKDDHQNLESPGGGSVFEDPALLVQECTLEPSFYTKAKERVERFLSTDIPPRGKLSNIVVLGDPMGQAAKKVDAPPSDEDQLVASLRRYRPDNVHHWGDGWAETMKLNAEQRTRLLEHPPIFVRSVSDKLASAARVRDAIMVPLMTALGYLDDESGAVWDNTAGQYRRVYWRREGPWIDGSNTDQGIEMTWNGTVDDVCARLAAIARFGKICESQLRTRFEDLPDSDPYRDLLSTGLREFGAGVVQRQGKFETVAVALDSLEESISLFDRSELNVVAAHDQRTRPGDKANTIEHFETWESKIEKYVREFFPQRKPKILRIAVLFQNFDKFDGLRFDEDLTIRRWQLLKAKRGEDNRWTFNPRDVDRLEAAARDLLKEGARL